MNEIKRQETKREQVLRELRKAGMTGVTNAELSKISLRYGGHLGKLYELGYKIHKEHLGEGLFRYTLLEEPESPKVRKPALDTLLESVKRQEIIDADMLMNTLNSLGISVRYKAGTHQA